MQGLIIRSSSKENIMLLSSLAKKMGEAVKSLNTNEMEEIYLVQLMNKVKTGKNVSRATVLQKLRSK